jgi:hypothetical protein
MKPTDRTEGSGPKLIGRRDALAAPNCGRRVGERVRHLARPRNIVSDATGDPTANGLSAYRATGFRGSGDRPPGRPFLQACSNLDLEGAYRVTAAVRAAREARGEHPVGRKIGSTNRTIWAEYNVHAPIWGYVYDSTVRDLGREALEVSLIGFAEPRIEPEIVFGLAASPTPGMDERALIRRPNSLRLIELGAPRS